VPELVSLGRRRAARARLTGLRAKGRMISVTRLDGSVFMLDVDLILTIERTPDTLVWLTTGDRLLLRETPKELVKRITRHKRALARGIGLVVVNAGMA